MMSGHPVSCKNCGNEFAGKYCNQCGEKFYQDVDRSFSNIIGDAFHFITHFEGKFFNTLKAIVTRPGKLSFEYCEGMRKKYFKSISFFLMLVILYLLFPFFAGLNMKLRFHMVHTLYGSYASDQVQKASQRTGYSTDNITQLYEQKSEKTSKFLLFILIPFGGLIGWALGYRKRPYYYDNVIYAVEVLSVFILWGFLILPLLLFLYTTLGFEYPFTTETQIGLAGISVFFLYLLLSSKRFFGFSRWYAVVFAILFCLLTLVLVEFIYKFLLFFITIHLI